MKKVLIVILGIIIISGGLYYYRNINTNTPTQKTYVDRQREFSFTYPANWSICKNSNNLFIYALVSDNCALAESDSSDPSIKSFMVRNLGDINRNFLEAGTLKEDGGWYTDNNNSGTSRTIYHTLKDIAIIMLALPSDQKILDKIASTFSLSSIESLNSPSITSGYFDVATGATFNGGITLKGNNFNKFSKVKYQVLGRDEVTTTDPSTISLDGTQLQFVLPGEYANKDSITAWVQTDSGLSNKILIELVSKGAGFKLI